MPGDALDVFIAYSREDETLRRELEEQLAGLEREGLIHDWKDRRITPGEEWRGWIDGDLTHADLVLLMVSGPFLESGYCDGSEIKHALERHAWGQGKVIPIIARPCDWSTTTFAQLDTLPHGVGPVTEWHDRGDAWENVVQGIREVARRLIKARLESTAAYRIAVRSPIREEEQPSPASPPEEVVEDTTTARWAVLGGFAVALVALVATLYLVLWRSPSSDDGGSQARAAVESTAVDPRPMSSASQQRQSAPIDRSTEPPTATPSETEPGTPAESSPAEEPLPGPDLETTPEESPVEEVVIEEDSSPVDAETSVEAAEPEPTAGEEDARQETAGEAQEIQDFSRSLGILAAPGAEEEGQCLAVLVADDRALTSGACARASAVMVMGGNALAATRDEIFDLEPRQTPRGTDVAAVQLLQRLGEPYGFVATGLTRGFDHESLEAYFVEESRIQHVECDKVSRLAEINGDGRAYVENAMFEGFALLVEDAAGEAISVAGAGWVPLLHEVLESTEESLAGYVCELSSRPPGNLVFSDGERAVGIGYSCDPFDRLEPEVRDSLPEEIRQLDLDCIASLSESRD